MAIEIQKSGDVVRIVMSGRFDFNVHREFKGAYMELLDDSSVKEIEIEMSRIEYLDSSALGMLMLLKERAQTAGKVVILAHPSGAVAQVLEVANFGRIFTIKN